MDSPLWPAPAKINLFLHITGRREDGYHLLQTAFQFVDYCDWLAFDLRHDGEITRGTALKGVDRADDLTVRAAHLLQEQLQQQGRACAGVDIQLQKRLPMGGGLGGGSSDAATTLVALNQLWRVGLDVDRLAALGLTLGADVPVFVRGDAAWAEGIGEELTPIAPHEPWLLIITPDCHVATAAIFADPELTRDAQAITIAGFLSGQGRNVCEAVVRQRHPQVAAALDWLSQFAAPRMSGTGSCLFAPFDDRAAAQQILEQLPTAWQGFIAKAQNRSPLQKRLYNEKLTLTGIESANDP